MNRSAIRIAARIGQFGLAIAFVDMVLASGFGVRLHLVPLAGVLCVFSTVILVAFGEAT